MLQSEKSKEYLFPINLIVDINENKHPDPIHSFNPERLPKDFEPSVNYILATLHPLEESVIRSVYGTPVNGKSPSIAEMSENMLLSQYRIRTLLRDAMTKLSQQDAWCILTQGVSGYIRYLKCTAGLPEAIAEEAAIEKAKTDEYNRLSEILIETLDLPAREYAVLERAGYKTAAEVVDAGPRKIRGTRNCGKKAFVLIMRSLETIGVDVSGWDNWINEKPKRKIV